MTHPEDRHHIVLTDLRLAGEALPVLMRDHLRVDHGASLKELPDDLNLNHHMHDVLHALDEYEEREGVRL